MKVELSSEQVQNMLFILIDKRNDAEFALRQHRPNTSTHALLQRTVSQIHELELILQVALKIREGDAA